MKRSGFLSLTLWLAVAPACGTAKPPEAAAGAGGDASGAAAAGGVGVTAGGGGRAGQPGGGGLGGGAGGGVAPGRAGAAGASGGTTGTAGAAGGGSGRDGGVAPGGAGGQAGAGGLGGAGGGSPVASGTPFVYIGSGFYTAGSSLHVLKLDVNTGALAPVQMLPSSASPSFLAVDPKRQFLYVNIESGTTGAAAYRIDQATGMLAKINEITTGAKGSAYISIDVTGKWLFQANYESFTVNVLSVKADGGVGAVVDTRMQGAMAFPHCVRPDPQNKFVFVPNRTGNTVSQYRLDAATGVLSANTPPSVPSPAGTGPRHIDFHPSLKFAYVINETNSTMTAYTFDSAAGTLARLQDISTVPAGYAGKNSPADMHMHPSGRFLYGANRDHSSIVIFEIDAGTGRLTTVGHQPSGGKGPRNFAIDAAGSFLVAGNLDTDTVAVFRIDAVTGKLTPVGTPAAVAKPAGVAIVYVPGK